MLKKLLILAFAGLLSPAYAAGTIPFSFYPQVDLQGRVMPGCKFYTIQAGTVSTPQNAYQDSALTQPLPNPQTCDASGRLPQMFFADGSVKVRLTSAAGVNVLTADNVLVVGASSGGGGGGTVDPTTILQTGDVKSRYGVGVHTGWVRMNGRTIGSATSGATERANADCQALFEYLWGADSSLAVSTGRGVSANADWVANKTIALPDARGRVLTSLDDMGNTAAGRLTSTYLGGGASPITLGNFGGLQSSTLSAANLAPHTHNGSGTTSQESVVHTHSYTYPTPGFNAAQGPFPVSGPPGATDTGTQSANHTHTYSFTTDTGSGLSATAFTNLMPLILITNYQKL